MTALAFERVGQGAPLVCLHPVGLDRRCWDELSLFLYDQVEMICVDLAGHGASADRSPDMDVWDDADLVARLLADLDIGTATVIGVSFGGMIAQALAVAHPDRVAALICCACPPGISGENRDSLAARGEPALKDGMQAIVETTMARWFTDAFRDTPPAQAVRARLLANNPENWAAAWQTISRFDLRDKLAEVDCPALCLAGRADPATPEAAMKALAEALPNSRLFVIDDAPHLLHIERSDVVAAKIRSFLAVDQ